MHNGTHSMTSSTHAAAPTNIMQADRRTNRKKERMLGLLEWRLVAAGALATFGMSLHSERSRHAKVLVGSAHHSIARWTSKKDLWLGSGPACECSPSTCHNRTAFHR